MATPTPTPDPRQLLARVLQGNRNTQPPTIRFVSNSFSFSEYGVFSSSLAELITENKPLAPFCWLKIGGNARFFAAPSTLDQLCQLCTEATQAGLPIRVIGGGSNLLVRAAGVDGLVLHLTGELAEVKTQGNTLSAGGGAPLHDAVSQAAAAGLAGLEEFAGIPGSVGGAVVSNSGVTNDDIGSRVKRVHVVHRSGEPAVMERDQLQFGFRRSNLEDLILAEVEMDLSSGDSAELTRRLQATWIGKRATQPPTDARVAQAFIEPSGSSIADLLDAAGMRTAAEGEVAMSSQFPGYLMVNENADAEQVLALTSRIMRAVEVQSGIQLQPQLKIW